MNAPENTTTKRCSKCGCEYPATAEYFHIRSNCHCGLAAACKSCRNSAKAEYLKNHPEEVRQQNREYYKANSQKNTEKARKQRENKPEQFRERSRTYRQKHPEKVRAANRAYRESHPELNHESHARRDARLRSASGNHKSSDIKTLLKTQNGRCYYCHAELDIYHVDHVIPLSRGGSNGPENIVLACPSCNSRKSAKMPHEWPEGGRLL